MERKNLVGKWMVGGAGVLVVGIAMYLTVWGLRRVEVADSEVVEDQELLQEYLGRGSEVAALEILKMDEWQVTEDCVSPAAGAERIFCFAREREGEKLTIKIYPNQPVLRLTEPARVDTLLNASIFAILEEEFNKDPALKARVYTEAGGTPVFSW